MKVALICLGFVCLIATLHALPLQDNGVLGGIENFMEFDMEDLPEKDFIIKSDGGPMATPRPPQVHHNNVRGQGPFSGRLTNIVANQKGLQKTQQKNRILFNMNPENAPKEKLNDQ